MRFVLLLALAACHKKVALTPHPLDSTLAGTDALSAEELARLAAERASAVAHLRDNFARVYFETDSASLGSEARAALADNAGVLARHRDIKVEVQGHADERGTTEYNLALGQRRAASVVTFLQGQGVDDARLAAISYGEELPIAAWSAETAWAANRRAEFRITWGGSADVSGTVL
jgi:peptidoglycan-associated lipoprotein